MEKKKNALRPESQSQTNMGKGVDVGREHYPTEFVWVVLLLIVIHCTFIACHFVLSIGMFCSMTIIRRNVISLWSNQK